MEHYRRKTQETLSRFLNNKITLDECTAALDKALASLAPWIRQEYPVALRILTTVNNEAVMKEVERRNQGRCVVHQ